jgi:hypothetical protein
MGMIYLLPLAVFNFSRFYPLEDSHPKYSTIAHTLLCLAAAKMPCSLRIPKKVLTTSTESLGIVTPFT